MKIVTAVLLVLAATAAAAQERTYDREFPVDPGARFSLETHKGNITVRTHGGSTILVHARIYPDQGRNPELVDHVKIKERSGPHAVDLEVDCDQNHPDLRGLLQGGWTLPMVDFEITVPDDADLELESHKAHFDLEVPSGRVEIESHKGRGTISGIRGPFELETHKGKFEVTIDRLAGASIETHKGDVRVLLRDTSDLELTGSSYKGRLRFEGLDIPVTVSDGGQSQAHYRTGSGRNKLSLSTHKGTITVSF
jgi:hypothetical protein